MIPTFTHIAVAGGNPILNKKYNIAKSERYTIAVTIWNHLIFPDAKTLKLSGALNALMMALAIQSTQNIFDKSGTLSSQISRIKLILNVIGNAATNNRQYEILLVVKMRKRR